MKRIISIMIIIIVSTNILVTNTYAIEDKQNIKTEEKAKENPKTGNSFIYGVFGILVLSSAFLINAGYFETKESRRK